MHLVGHSHVSSYLCLWHVTTCTNTCCSEVLHRQDTISSCSETCLCSVQRNVWTTEDRWVKHGPTGVSSTELWGNKHEKFFRESASPLDYVEENVSKVESDHVECKAFNFRHKKVRGGKQFSGAQTQGIIFHYTDISTWMQKRLWDWRRRKMFSFPGNAMDLSPLHIVLKVFGTYPWVWLSKRALSPEVK